MVKRFFLLLFLFISYGNMKANVIERVEPPNWWVGMNSNKLQLMLYGKDISYYKIDSNSDLIKIERVHKADSPNYLFVDLVLQDGIKAGDYTFTLSRGVTRESFSYTLNKREPRDDFKTFSSADMVYLIMPDRFANGDPSNDNHKDAQEISNRLEHYGRHGGDIEGIIKSLDYLNSIGVTAIWSTPMLFDNEPEASYHGYACADYYRIDPRFGSNDMYKDLVKQAKSRGIKIIKDIVPNHCGMAHWWMSDLPFEDWIHKFDSFTRSNYAMSTHFDPYASKVDNDLCTRGWFDTSMPDMNLKNPFVLNYFIQNAIWWVEWSGISGIRVDTFPYSDKFAIANWIKAILQEYPSINIVGEAWFGSAQEIAYWEGGARNADGYNSYLPSVMDFPLYDAIQKAFLEDGDPGWGEGMFRIYRSLALDNIYVNPIGLMVFGDNHDTHRLFHAVGYDTKKFKMALTLLATIRGVPQIYYGTEIMLSSLDGTLGHGPERVNMPGGWSGDSKNVFTGELLTPIESDVLKHFSKIFNWRKTSEIIHVGNTKHYWPTDNLYVYFRYTDSGSVMIILNNNNRDIKLDWSRYAESLERYTKGKDIISGLEYVVGQETIIETHSSVIIELY